MASIIEKRDTTGAISSIEFQGEDFDKAVAFLMDCIEYADDEDLVHLSDHDAIVSQVDGYEQSFGEDLPELLHDGYWMMVCWNKAVNAEKDRRRAIKTENQEGKKMATISKEELRTEFAKAWDNYDRMVNYCTNKVAATAVLPTGEIITVDKESIKKDFCFGESGYDFDEAQEAAAMARKSHEYFKSQNMKHFRSWIDEIADAMDLHSNYRLIIGGCAYSGQSEDCKLRYFEICRLTQVLDALGGSAFLEEIPGKEITVNGRTGRVATNEEAEIILNAYKEAAAKHEKKVDAYLKKYGTSKVNSWTYWRDA